ncbi:translocation/assembly module TamB domain-containing protein [Salinimicrobium sediminilitoris]|uniref:translocation/assembly module TamB domain-containing protein n=1 Tax=Salinimicrobium sediminilitoris TaxID=2876715 RepID=UPI001E2E7486|nr:translocation/assembly module TamB domain-containing protein [Salinimicrobium sediminilitoris]MCC8358705.1 translocation/assembly module TamB [Salinimicrobium sediminilitoris]
MLIVFSIPSVQTFVARKITDSLKESKDVDIRIGRVGLTYSGKLNLKDVIILDHHQDTLIFSERIKTSATSLRSIYNNNPTLGATTARELSMHMKVYEGEERDNLNIFLNKLKGQKKKEPTPFMLKVARLEVVDGDFSYTNQNLNTPEVINLDELNILASDLLVENSDVYVDIERLSGFENRGIRVDYLSTNFGYTSEEMVLEDLQIETPYSKIDSDIRFDITKGFAGFINKVPVEMTLRPSIISTNDLEPFYDKFGKDQKINISTTLDGILNDFMLVDLKMNGLDRTRLEGDLQITNSLSSMEGEFSLNGEITNLSTNYYDLINLLPGLLRDKLPKELRELGNVQLEGDIFVSENSLSTDANLFSQLGTAQVDLEMKGFGEGVITSYKGRLVVRDFNVGRLANVQDLGTTSLNVTFDGRGFTTETLNTQVQGSISKLVFKDYAYNNLKLRGTLKAPLFNGNVISLDPNLRMEFNGLADFSADINVYDFEASVAHADLAALNLVQRDSISNFQGDVIMNIEGTNLNNFEGEIYLLNTSYKNDNDTYMFKDLEITSDFDGPVRTIEVHSPDVINGTIEGIFDITEVPALVENAVGSLYTNYRPNKITTDQYLNFDFDIYNKIVEVFYPEIALAPNTFIRGSVESDESEFRLAFRSPQIEAFNNLFEKVNIQVDNSNPLFNTFIEIDSVATSFYNIKDFNLINVTLNDTLFMRSEFKGGPKSNDEFNLNLYHTINENNNSVVGLQPSDLKFKESVWHLNEEGNRSNRIIFSKGFNDVVIDSLVLSHENEEIRLSGVMRDSTYKDFQMEFDDVDLYKITPEIPSLEMGGIVNGSLNLLQQDGAYYPNTSLTVNDLTLNDQMLGILNLDVMGNRDLSLYNVNTSLRNAGLESLSAIGEISVEEDSPEIALDVDLKNFNMAAFSPLGKDVISNIRGLVSGEAYISGDYRNPEIEGRLFLDNAGLSVPYLEVDYAFEEGAVVNLTQQQFNFDEIGITDTKYNTKGILDGTISHTNFRDWVLGLNVSTDRLLVLDTEYDEEALYYGTAFIGGNASIYGPTSELVIDVIAATRRGTVFKIPISDSESIGDNSFIHFLSPEEKAARLAGEELEFQEVKGLELNFDLDVTNDALVELDIDGSILRGRGAGTLLIEINTLGKFNMWGDFIANTGEYIFNYGALQKRFEVRPGGSINWNGNPALADLNISAVYEGHANPAIILDNPGISRRIPVEVVINLEGELVQPDFSFDLEYPNVASTVRSELEYKIETSGNSEAQAFSLLALGQFYTPDVFGGSAGSAILGGVFQSASSGLFSSLVGDDGGVFEVGLNYEQGSRTPEQSMADRFGVTLSTQISERVLINGQVGVPVGGVTETVIVGNLEIEFLLNEEGNLRAKIFNRENNIQYLGEELGFTQGIGLSYQVDFDTFKELLRKVVDREISSSAIKEEEEEEEGPVEKEKSLAPDYIRFPGADDL